MTIPKLIKAQFVTILNAAGEHSLCVVQTTYRTTGKKAYVLCAQDSKHNFIPLAQLGKLSELHHPSNRDMKLI